ncbi:MAG: phage tail tube protein [Hafnia sp.]|uniref:phage tail tube protein n=1 Tax=Hafnia TaxID=568 RepID=UPI00061CE9D2|nr:phage tail tube protein [Hafnia alvei]KKF38895.1 tail protein [Hafnia alvei]MBW3474311.1 phage tail protein [Hafnia alvei]
MAAPNPLKPVKGAKTTLWLYAGNGDPFANPLVDIDWSRMANIKDLQPGELSADAEDNNYLDDENADWKSTAQGQKSAGDTTVTLAWKPGEDVQKKLLTLFDSGEVCTYKIKYPNGTVDLFNGWISSLGKTVQAKEEITRSVKITGVGRPRLAEEDTVPPVSVSGITASPASANVAVGATTKVTFTVKPDDATDKTLRVASSDKAIATVTLVDNVATIKGIKAGAVKVIGMTSDGDFVASSDITVQ